MIDSQLKERVKKFLSYCRISNTEFAEIASVTPAYINSIKKNISFEVLEKIAELNPRLNLAWLLWGKGEMLTTATDKERLISENEILKYVVSIVGLLINQKGLPRGGLTAYLLFLCFFCKKL